MPKPDLAARFRTAIDLHEAGVQMMRLNLRRRHPEASEAEIQARFLAWLDEDPQENPDLREVPWPRS